jgi:iron uptake system component EfeO
MWVPPARKSLRALPPVAAAVVSALVLAGCGSGSSSTPGAASTGASTGPTSPSGPSTVSVTLTNDGCSPSATTVASGPMTFQVRNQNATAVSELELLSGERIVGEKENLAPGFSGSFSLDLDAGTYSLYCPGVDRRLQRLHRGDQGRDLGADVAGVLLGPYREQRGRTVGRRRGAGPGHD